MPKKKKKAEREEEEQDAFLRNDSSSEQLDADGDSSSEVSSEINFNFEYAQMEVTMKALGSNGERSACILESSRVGSVKSLYSSGLFTFWQMRKFVLLISKLYSLVPLTVTIYYVYKNLSAIKSLQTMFSLVEILRCEA